MAYLELGDTAPEFLTDAYLPQNLRKGHKTLAYLRPGDTARGCLHLPGSKARQGR